MRRDSNPGPVDQAESPNPLIIKRFFVLKFNLSTQNTLVGGQLGGLFPIQPTWIWLCQFGASPVAELSIHLPTTVVQHPLCAVLKQLGLDCTAPGVRWSGQSVPLRQR